MQKTAYEQAICLYQRLLGNGTQPAKSNLVPRVLRLFGRLLDTRRDSGVLEFYYWRISAVKQCKPLWGSQSKHLNFSNFPEPLLATNHWPKSLRTLGTRLVKVAVKVQHWIQMSNLYCVSIQLNSINGISATYELQPKVTIKY